MLSPINAANSKILAMLGRIIVVRTTDSLVELKRNGAMLVANIVGIMGSHWGELLKLKRRDKASPTRPNRNLFLRHFQ